jgi:hypothetical protein
LAEAQPAPPNVAAGGAGAPVTGFYERGTIRIRQASAATRSAPEDSDAAGESTQRATSAATIGPSRSRNSMWLPSLYQASFARWRHCGGNLLTKRRIGVPGFQKAPTRGPVSLVARCFLRAERQLSDAQARSMPRAQRPKKQGGQQLPFKFQPFGAASAKTRRFTAPGCCGRSLGGEAFRSEKLAAVPS